MSKQIQLSQGKYAIVDDEDFEYLNQWKWRFLNVGYAIRSQRNKGEKTSGILMHRLIMNAEDSFFVDHINGNKLDNRRLNLRVCTPSQNSQNKIKKASSSSKYKGVHWDEKSKKWRSGIFIDKKILWLGFFESQDQAALAYNQAAILHHGEFAKINQIPE